jgi:hypothetical protein
LQHWKGEDPTAALVPDSIPYKPFDSTITLNVLRWLEKNGNNILYIHGGIDTWSACRVIPSAQVNAKSFIIPGANHFVARVKAMPADMQKNFMNAINEMIGIKPDASALR